MLAWPAVGLYCKERPVSFTRCGLGRSTVRIRDAIWTSIKPSSDGHSKAIFTFWLCLLLRLISLTARFVPSVEEHEYVWQKPLVLIRDASQQVEPAAPARPGATVQTSVHILAGLTGWTPRGYTTSQTDPNPRA